MAAFRVAVYAVIISSFIFSYDFSIEYLSQHPKCRVENGQQSPVNIDVSQTKYYDERNFRIVSSNYTIFQTSPWENIPDAYAVGFEGNFGSVKLIKNWAIFNYNLTQVLFRVKSSHSFNGKFYDGEMQLIHKFDENYRTPGRYIKEDSKFLVISIPLRAITEQSKGNNTISNLLQDLNVVAASTAQNLNTIYPTRRVKLNRIVQHSEQVIYNGRLPYGNCEDAIFILDPRYQYIRQDELDSLATIIKAQGYTNSKGEPSNTRSIQAKNQPTTVFRNTENIESMIIEPSIFQYDTSTILKADIFWLLGLILISIYPF